MNLSNDVIDQFKKTPQKIDYNAGFERARIDYWCGETTLFQQRHSRSFRDGYAAGYAKCVIEADERSYADSSEYERMKRATADYLDKLALVKYKDAPSAEDLDGFRKHIAHE